MSTNDNKRGRPLDYSVTNGRGERIGSSPSLLIASHLLASFGGRGGRIERGGALLFWNSNGTTDPETIQATVSAMEA